MAGYFAALVSCIALKSQLTINPNRAGEKIQLSHYSNHSASHNHRLHGSCATPSRLPLLFKEFNHVLPPRSWSRIREAELYSSVGWTRAISCGRYPRQSLDQPTPEVWCSDNRRAEGDLGRRSVRGTLYYCPDQHPAGEAVVLSRFLRRSVSAGDGCFVAALLTAM